MTVNGRGPALGILLLTIVLVSCGSGQPTPTQTAALPPSSGTVIDPPQLISDFTLTDQTGKLMHWNDLHGRIALVFFGYTHCPDVCPITVANFTRIKSDLGGAAQQVAFVFISVDGTRDTPDVVAKFISAFDPSFIGLTGKEDDVAKIGKQFGAIFNREDNALVVHSTRQYLIDAQGRLRVAYALDALPETIAADMRKFIRGEA